MNRWPTSTGAPHSQCYGLPSSVVGPFNEWPLNSDNGLARLAKLVHEAIQGGLSGVVLRTAGVFCLCHANYRLLFLLALWVAGFHRLERVSKSSAIPFATGRGGFRSGPSPVVIVTKEALMSVSPKRTRRSGKRVGDAAQACAPDRCRLLSQSSSPLVGFFHHVGRLSPFLSVRKPRCL